MFDPEPLYPKSYHPVLTRYDANLRFRASHYSRTFRPTKYYLIDFGYSRRFDSKDGIRLGGVVGQDDSVPEMSLTVPYDPFPVDVYHLGNMLLKFYGVRALRPRRATILTGDNHI